MDDRRLARLRVEHAYKTIYEPNAPSRSETNRFAFHDTAISEIGSEANLFYLEFGVARGASIRRFAEQFKNPESTFYGFDSFVGLPENWTKYQAGHFSTQGVFPFINDQRVSFVRGWFQNTVPQFFKDNRGPWLKKTVLVHYDADLYSSTLFLLTSLWWQFSDYYFIMDEFFGDELVALADFKEAFPIDISFISEMHGGYSNALDRNTPHKIFGRIRRTDMIVDGVDTRT